VGTGITKEHYSWGLPENKRSSAGKLHEKEVGTCSGKLKYQDVEVARCNQDS